MYSETPDADRRIGDEKREDLEDLGDLVVSVGLDGGDMRYQKAIQSS